MATRKQHPLHHIALEFMARFPGARRFGRLANEKQLQAVMTQAGWDPEELLWRIQQWSKTRTDLRPEHLLKPLPEAAIAREKGPGPKAPRVLPPIKEEWRRRALWLYTPYEEEDV